MWNPNQKIKSEFDEQTMTEKRTNPHSKVTYTNNPTTKDQVNLDKDATFVVDVENSGVSFRINITNEKDKTDEDRESIHQILITKNDASGLLGMLGYRNTDILNYAPNNFSVQAPQVLETPPKLHKMTETQLTPNTETQHETTCTDSLITPNEVTEVENMIYDENNNSVGIQSSEDKMRDENYNRSPILGLFEQLISKKNNTHVMGNIQRSSSDISYQSMDQAYNELRDSNLKLEPRQDESETMLIDDTQNRRSLLNAENIQDSGLHYDVKTEPISSDDELTDEYSINGENITINTIGSNNDETCTNEFHDVVKYTQSSGDKCQLYNKTKNPKNITAMKDNPDFQPSVNVRDLKYIIDSELYEQMVTNAKRSAKSDQLLCEGPKNDFSFEIDRVKEERCDASGDYGRLEHESSITDATSTKDKGEKTYSCTVCDYSSELCDMIIHNRTKHSHDRLYKCILCDYKHHQLCKIKPHLRIHLGIKPYKCSECPYSSSFQSSVKQHMRQHTGNRHIKCHHCAYRCSHMGHLKTHMATHTDERAYKCSVCEYSTSNSSYIKIHEKIHSGVKNFKCTKCDYATVQKSLLKRHVALKHGDKKYKCSQCEFCCVSEARLVVHTRKHTGEKPFRCSICGFRSASLNYITVHKDKCHNKVDKPHKCKLCKYATQWAYRLTMHVTTHERKAKSYDKNRAKKLKCEDCDYRTAFTRDLVIHKRKHSGEKPLKCKDCEYCTGDPSSLRSHRKTKHMHGVYMKCETCSYQTCRGSDLRMHLRKHSHETVKLYKCDAPDCKFDTNYRSCLKVHKRRHNGERPFVCTYENCTFRGVDQSSLKAHTISHTKIRPYKCKYCDYSAGYYQHLKCHELKHVNGEIIRRPKRKPKPPHTQYYCDECDYNTNRPFELNVHKRTHCDDRPYQCLWCGFRTNHRGTLSMHINRHTKESPYKCTLCPYRHKEPSGVRKHTRKYHPESMLPLSIKYPQEKVSGGNVTGENVSGNNISGQNVSGQNVSGENVSGQNVSGQNVSRRNVSGQNVSGKNVSDQNVSDQNVGAQNVSDQNVRSQNVPGQNLSDENIATNIIAEFSNLDASTKTLKCSDDGPIVIDSSPENSQVTENTLVEAKASADQNTIENYIPQKSQDLIPANIMAKILQNTTEELPNKSFTTRILHNNTKSLQQNSFSTSVQKSALDLPQLTNMAEHVNDHSFCDVSSSSANNSGGTNVGEDSTANLRGSTSSSVLMTPDNNNNVPNPNKNSLASQFDSLNPHTYRQPPPLVNMAKYNKENIMPNAISSESINISQFILKPPVKYNDNNADNSIRKQGNPLWVMWNDLDNLDQQT